MLQLLKTNILCNERIASSESITNKIITCKSAPDPFSSNFVTAAEENKFCVCPIIVDNKTDAWNGREIRAKGSLRTIYRPLKLPREFHRD